MKKPPTPEEEELKKIISEQDVEIDGLKNTIAFLEKFSRCKSEVEIKGIKIEAHYDSQYEAYVLYLGTESDAKITPVSENPERAKQAFDKAVELAVAGKTFGRIYKESVQFIDNLNDEDEKEKEKRYNLWRK